MECTGGAWSSGSKYGVTGTGGVRQRAVESSMRQRAGVGRGAEGQGHERGLHIGTQRMGDVQRKGLEAPLLRRFGVVGTAEADTGAGL